MNLQLAPTAEKSSEEARNVAIATLLVIDSPRRGVTYGLGMEIGTLGPAGTLLCSICDELVRRLAAFPRESCNANNTSGYA